MPMPLAASCSAAAMEIGDLVTYKGRAYVLRGLEPMSVPNRRAELEDPETGEVVVVPLAEVSQQDP
jgi:hypothetical protein